VSSGAGAAVPIPRRTHVRIADPTVLAGFGRVVVVRGGEAMAPRDLLPLRLPKEALQQMADQAEEGSPEAAAKPTLEMLERGPEITETR